MTSVRLGPVANTIVHVEELTPMADEPVVMQREEARNAAFRERPDDRRGEAGEMVDVRDVGPEVVDEPRRDGAERLVPIRVFVRARVAERVVHPRDVKAVARFGPNRVLSTVWILIARQDEDLVAKGLPKRPGMCVRVDLGAALCGRRESMRHDEDPHQTILDRNGFQPLTADSAPRYW